MLQYISTFLILGFYNIFIGKFIFMLIVIGK